MKVYQLNEMGFIEEEKELAVTVDDVLPSDFTGVEPPPELKKPRWVKDGWVEGEITNENN